MTLSKLVINGGADTIMKMAITLMDLKQYQDAVKYFEMAVSISNDIAFLKAAWNNKGLCLLRIKNYVEAIPCFRKVLSYDEKHPEATSNLNTCLGALKKLLVEINEKKRIIEDILKS
jgi:tetratricopeptide (TPR) repeat protein